MRTHTDSSAVPVRSVMPPDAGLDQLSFFEPLWDEKGMMGERCWFDIC